MENVFMLLKRKLILHENHKLKGVYLFISTTIKTGVLHHKKCTFLMMQYFSNFFMMRYIYKDQ